jgi:hypothetical protein
VNKNITQPNTLKLKRNAVGLIIWIALTGIIAVGISIGTMIAAGFTATADPCLTYWQIVSILSMFCSVGGIGVLIGVITNDR